jgi:hypothetical protein
MKHVSGSKNTEPHREQLDFAAHPFLASEQVSRDPNKDVSTTGFLRDGASKDDATAHRRVVCGP